MVKPPRPGLIGATVPPPPPPSCSPFSGKSSSNTITASLPVGSGVGSTSTLTGAKVDVVVHGVEPPSMLQAGGVWDPPMVWPQIASPACASSPLQAAGFVLAGNGLAASPGNTEM